MAIEQVDKDVSAVTPEPSQPKIIGKALGIIYRTIATHLTHKDRHVAMAAGFRCADPQSSRAATH